MTITLETHWLRPNTYYFCSKFCQEKFKAEPDKYAA